MTTMLVSVVGRHNAGKTALIERLVVRLKSRGLRVAVLKHTRGEFDLDTEGTDTWRHAQAGADVVAIAGPKGGAIIECWQREQSLEEILRRFPRDLDLVIVEGYKAMPLPKIVVCRDAREELRGYGGRILAVVTSEPIWTGVEAPCLAPDDIDGLLRVLGEQGFLSLRS